MLKYVFFVALVLLAIYHFWPEAEIHHPAGMVAPNEPIQTALNKTSAFVFDDYLITPLASFQLEARVLSAKHYRFGRESDLAPVDLAMGWGPMSDQEVLDQMKISQSSRFFWWRAKTLPLPKQTIISHSANMHMIPSTPKIETMLKSVKRGQVVKLEGYLVAVMGKDGWRWKSSLKRTDSGNGACEIVWVKSLEFR